MNTIVHFPVAAQDLPFVLLALGFVVATLTALVPARPDRRLERRLERARRAASTFEAVASQAPTSVRRQREVSVLGGFGGALSRLLPRTEVLRTHLDRAGIGLAASDLVLGALALGGVIAFFVVFVLGTGWVIALALATIVAVAAPVVVVRRGVARREARFLASFPDALDLVVRGIKSGLPVTEALNAIAREMPEPTASLFAELCANLRIGKTLSEALDTAGRRMSLPEFRFFAISLVVQQETGGNLSEILQNLATMLRRRQQMRLKVRAMSSEARASAMIIGSLPFVTGTVIYWVNPEYIVKLFTDPRGWVMLGFAVGSMLMGVAVMAKMVRFEI